MANTLNAVSASTAATTSATTSTGKSTTAEDKMLNKDMFLQLMVAQLRNQSPLNPVDAKDFLGQLSQISGVEQMVQMRQEMEGIHQTIKDLTGQEAAGAAQ